MTTKYGESIVVPSRQSFNDRTIDLGLVCRLRPFHSHAASGVNRICARMWDLDHLLFAYHVPSRC